MCIAGFFYEIYKINVIFPCSDICLINRYRNFAAFIFYTFLHPHVILPGKISQFCHNGDHGRRFLRTVSIGIWFSPDIPSFDFDLILISTSCLHSRNKQFKDTWHWHAVHWQTPSIPSVKISHYTDTYRIRCPDSKIGSLYTTAGPRMRTQLLISFVINTCTEGFLLFFCNLAGTFICIIKSFLHVSSCYTEAIFRNSFQRDHHCIISRFIFQCHWIDFFSN